MNKMNKFFFILLTLIVITPFFFSIGSANTWTLRKDFKINNDKQLELQDFLTNYGTITIKEREWYDIFGLWEKDTKILTLEKNTPNCSHDCLSIIKIELKESGKLIEEVIWKRSFDGMNSWVDWKGFTSWGLEIETEVDSFETICEEEEVDDEKNGTKHMKQICSQNKIGTEKKWLPYNYEVKDVGIYKVRLIGTKKPTTILDWQFKTSGIILDEWAIWGGVIGENGTQANVTLISPANNSTSFSNFVIFNASAKVTGGAGLVNMSFCSNISGNWQCGDDYEVIGGEIAPISYQSFSNSLKTGLRTYYDFDEISGTTAIDKHGTNNGTLMNGVLINQPGILNKSYQFDGVNDYVSSFDSIGNTHTISMWFYPTAPGEIGQLWGFQSAGIWDEQLTVTNTGELLFFIMDIFIYSTNRVSYNKWNHVIISKKPNTHPFIILNGLKTNSLNTSSSYIHNKTAWIGAQNRDLGQIKYFQGRIDEFAFWNRVLTDQEIKKLTMTSSTDYAWNKTIPANTSILWNVKACDSDGDCGFSPLNYTLHIDGMPPNITINSGQGLQNYGALMENHTLNLTITDINLDKVWINYNGTNRTIQGCVSGIANITSFSLVKDLYNATIYANDTAGNMQKLTINWSYKIFENSRNYTPSILETALDTFTINLTTNFSLSNVYLYYNETEYPVSLLGGVYTKQLAIPPITNTSTIPIYWKFVYSGENITSYISNQTINKLIFNICNNTINNTLINFTTKSAINHSLNVNSIIKTNWLLSASKNVQPTNFSYKDLNGNKFNYAFCTNTNNTTIYAQAEIEYDANGYAINYYYLNNINLTANNPQNITLYLLNDNLSTPTILKVVSSSQQPKANHQINIQSYDIGTGTFYLVGMAKTNFNGEDVVYLNWFDTLYKFTILDENKNVIKTTETTKISNNPTIIELDKKIKFEYDKFKNFVYELYYDNITQNFVLTYTKPSGEVDKGCLRVYKHEVDKDTLICNNCENSASATIYCNIGNYGNGTYVALFYATGSFSLVDWMYVVIKGIQKNIYNLLGNVNASFYAFVFALLIVTALFINATFGIIALIIGLIGASVLGFTTLQWQQMSGIIIIGGLIIWLLKK